jgi:hypothetical protein
MSRLSVNQSRLAMHFPAQAVAGLDLFNKAIVCNSQIN